ncbi:MAG: hypothetical protein AAB378_02855 [Patescibacteria group bacterium]
MESAEKPLQQPEEGGVETGPKYNFGQIERLQKSAESLVQQLKEKIDGDEYDMLIGDDVSGRIPTLILRSVINERKRQLHMDKSPQENEIPTKFIVGGRAYDVENMEEVMKFLEKIKPQIKKKALLVTEFMDSGNGMNKMARAFNGAGIDFDVATFASFEDPDFYQKNCDNLRGHKIFVGQEGFEHVSGIYGQRSFVGVMKHHSHESAHAIRYKKRYNIHLEPQGSINKAHHDVKILADDVIKKVWG